MNLETSTVNVLLVALIGLNTWNIGQIFALKLQIAALSARLDHVIENNEP
jgi:hypothetical protein